jgi:hypothetical protein
MEKDYFKESEHGRIILKIILTKEVARMWAD